MADKLVRKQSKMSVYLYVPNIIGYIRVLMNIVAFALCFSNKIIFSVLYFVSFVCDGVDGWCARKFNQVSTFGAVLDMLTDRTFLIGKTSHKDVKDSTNWLFKAYYGNRTFMAYCCVLYIILFLLAEKQTENLMDIILHSIQQKTFLSLLVVISLFGWAVKQAVNVIQMKTAADVCVLHDINKKQKAG
ncbi:CDP-diacylglycerol--inositol 3-phosphatidyltransferase 1 [Cucurbita argyrosperma subsp. argyrosperma]|nr:CDP-diacylglycerol--inositol 3-phosphatidyltransferase 1 [Cucurbita argyrosperma subsp. argyrosperma]